MTSLYRPLLTWLRSTKAGQIVLFASGLLFAYWGYFFWQVVAAFVAFLTLGSGEGHTDEGLLVSAGFLLLHLGVVSWLWRRRMLYTRWWAWALNVAVPIGLFTYYTFLPWSGKPVDSAYQQYRFVKGAYYYRITLQKPGDQFDISDITNQKQGNTTLLLMGDYHVRHDTIFLQEWNGPRQCFIYRHALVGFGNSASPIMLTRERDITPLSLKQRE